MFQGEISECIYWVINFDFPNLIQLGGARPGVTITLPGFACVYYICVCVVCLTV